MSSATRTYTDFIVARYRVSDSRATGLSGDNTHEVVTAVDVRPRNVLVLGPGLIPKTPSGKLRRAYALALLKLPVGLSFAATAAKQEGLRDGRKPCGWRNGSST